MSSRDAGPEVAEGTHKPEGEIKPTQEPQEQCVLCPGDGGCSLEVQMVFSKGVRLTLLRWRRLHCERRVACARHHLPVSSSREAQLCSVY